MQPHPLELFVMRNVIIGYQYNKQQLFGLIKDFEKNDIRLQDSAYTYFYDGKKWVQFYDRQYDETGFNDERESEFTTDEFVEYLLNDETGQFWVVRDNGLSLC
jgi:hypothetical protein